MGMGVTTLPFNCAKCYNSPPKGKTMRRREFIALIGASVGWPFAAMAQEPGRTYRLGALSPAPRDAPLNMAYFGELRRHGFIEGQNLAVEYRAYGENVI
jgi:putative tryptophan/tyrosine transport system substrate-binding protein